MTMMMSILPGEGYGAFWALNVMLRYHNLGQHPSHSLITTTDKKLSTSNKSLQIQFHLQANFCSIDLFCTQKLKSLVNLVLTSLFLQLMSMLYIEIEKWVTSIDQECIQMHRLLGKGFAYLVFVNFGTPPHYLGLYKVHQKVCKFATKQLIKM